MVGNLQAHADKRRRDFRFAALSHPSFRCHRADLVRRVTGETVQAARVKPDPSPVSSSSGQVRGRASGQPRPDVCRRRRRRSDPPFPREPLHSGRRALPPGEATSGPRSRKVLPAGWATRPAIISSLVLGPAWSPPEPCSLTARRALRPSTHLLSGLCLCGATVGQAVLPVPSLRATVARTGPVPWVRRCGPVGVAHLVALRNGRRAPCLPIFGSIRPGAAS